MCCKYNYQLVAATHLPISMCMCTVLIKTRRCTGTLKLREGSLTALFSIMLQPPICLEFRIWNQLNWQLILILVSCQGVWAAGGPWGSIILTRQLRKLGYFVYLITSPRVQWGGGRRRRFQMRSKQS